MKVRETRQVGAGMGGSRTEVRVRKLKANEALPPGAVEVPEDTPEHPWRPE